MKKTILKSAVLLSVFTIIGKVIGFLRMMVVAYIFGATSDTDAYNLANGMVSNILYALSTAIAVSFLPIYVDKKLSQGQEETNKYTSKVITVLSVLAIGVSVLVCVAAPALAKITAPSYSEEQLVEVILYLRILAIGIIFSLVTSLLKSILDAEKIYGYGAFSGIIYSIVTIVFAVCFYKVWGIVSLVVAIPVAYFIQYIFLNWRVRKCVRIKPLFDIHDEDLRILLRMSIPVLLSNTTVEINQLVDRTLASFSTEGAVSALAYSANLNDLVISVIASSVITVFFTEFAGNSAKDDMDALKANLRKGISVLLIILLPISLISVMFGEEIVRIVYYRGAFGNEALVLTTLGTVIYAMSWIVVSIEKLCSKVFFSVNDTKTPMRISICAVVFNTIMSIIFVHYIGFAGIVLGTVLAEVLAVILNLTLLHKKIGNLGLKSMGLDIAKMFCGTILTGVMLYVIKNLIVNQMAIIRFVTATIVGMIMYGAFLIIFRCREVEWIKNMVCKKVCKK